MKRVKRVIVILCLAAVLCAALHGCTKNEDTGDPDRLGSWAHINQQIIRGEDWRRIVTDSSFQLGEKVLAGSWGPEDDKEDYYNIDYGTYPVMDGSTVAVPMAIEFARQHLNMSDEDAQYFAAFSTTHTAYENLILKQANTMPMIQSETAFTNGERPVDLIIATYPSDEELQFAKQHNVSLVTTPVCYDAFVFITHKDNPVDSLTVEQIRDIYSGSITNWRDVGGSSSRIAAYQREENSGSQTAMLNLVMEGTPMLPPETVKVIAGMGGLVETVAEYKNSEASIGYTYKYYVDTLYKNDNIKILQIDGVPADEDNIRTGVYPFSTCYYGVIREGEEGFTGGKFLQWMLSEQGQECIEQAGYIPYKLSIKANIVSNE